ncbi:hypothetical protein PM085_19085 [Halorubrum ezzemoulense]|jgi:hypothetical protein|uniref:Uncharacterized protein n=1 Tax=Halorubrum ezzemoulense TaxID=337243 RepID=A0ABT4Z832_HALEZ|nr:hypothetical protein [Halorubrum ezzemoulense]MDB2275763.1 hypothetical protein [Halorubrum ezzemoulense]MDB2294319.1 hypothetical protein [Halorubrum ezzemoulense]
MVKLPMNEKELEHLLEEQKNRTEERRKRRELSHIDESQLVEPAKRAIESDYCPEEGTVTWYEEPDIFVRDRGADEPASRVAERPDLICEWQPANGGPSTLYLVELKKRFNKRGIGQIITYLWAARSGVKIIDGKKEYTLTGEEMLIVFLGAMEYKKPYYEDLVEWIIESLDLDQMTGIETLPLEPE